MLVSSPWGDVFDEFTARDIPYGFNHQDQMVRRRQGIGKELDKLVYPDEDGAVMGKQRVVVTDEHLKTRVERWNDYYNAKLRIIEGEIRDLTVRRGPFWHPTMLVVTAVFAFMVFLAVLAVDYAVLSEFWARVYSDEFGEVPADYVATVVIKSLQVVVAALAFHFFFQSLSREGRKLFAYFTFGFTALFLLGLGFLNAANSLPDDSILSLSQEVDGAEENRRALEQIGLAPAEGETASGATAAQDQGLSQANRDALRFTYAMVWFATLALLFIAVTSVAAMTLHVALRAISGLFGRIDNEHYFSNKSILNKRDMNLRLLRARRAREWLLAPEARAQIMKHCLAAFESGYIYGLSGNSRGPSMFSGLFGGRRRIQEEDDQKPKTEEGFLLAELAKSMKAARDMIEAGEIELVVVTGPEDPFVEADDEKEIKKEQYERRHWQAPKDEEEAPEGSDQQKS